MTLPSRSKAFHLYALYQVRRYRQLSQGEVARQAGVTKQTVHGIETGKQRASPRTARLLAWVLRVDVPTLQGTWPKGNV